MKRFSYDELNTALGSNFVLFVGSGVSAKYLSPSGEFATLVPGVPEAISNILRALEQSIEPRAYKENLIKQYYRDIYEQRKNKILDRIKFEEFIWQLEKGIVKPSERTQPQKISDLLACLYRCEGSQYNHNHEAIAKLLAAGRVEFLLTTNFDNAIELASGIKPFIQGKHVSPPTAASKLIKLHGDAISGNYVATTRNLMNLQSQQAYSYMPGLLSGKTVLVVGYSGVGDIDIYPHLEACLANGTKFLWVVREPDNQSQEEIKIPGIASGYFEGNLFSKKVIANPLLSLAGLRKLLELSAERAPEWQARLRLWAKAEISIRQHQEILKYVYQDYSEWPSFDLFCLSNVDKQGKINQSVAARMGFIERCVAVGSYLTARTHISFLKKKKLSRSIANKLAFFEGYIFWRLGFNQKALALLKPLTKHWFRPGVYKEATRTYIQVYSEIIRAKRHRKQATRGIPYLFNLIKNLRSHENKYLRTTDSLLSEVAFLEAEEFVGKGLNLERLISIYEKAKALQLWIPAKMAAVAIMRKRPLFGFNALKEFEYGEGAREYHSAKHSLIAISYWVPAIGYRLSVFLHVLISRVTPHLRHLRLKFRLATLLKNQRQWREVARQTTR